MIFLAQNRWSFKTCQGYASAQGRPARWPWGEQGRSASPGEDEDGEDVDAVGDVVDDDDDDVIVDDGGSQVDLPQSSPLELLFLPEQENLQNLSRALPSFQLQLPKEPGGSPTIKID